MSVTALQVATRAYRVLNVFMPGEAVPSPDGETALDELNQMIGSWAQQSGTIPVVAREVFDLTANKGGPSNPYTIGVGGNLNTARPPTQASITGCALLLTASSPDVELPLAYLTDDAWQKTQVKELTNSQPTSVYYNPTYATSELGTLYLWPVPDNATNDLVLYLEKQIASFANLSTAYTFPPGYEDALVYNLADRLADICGRVMPAAAARRAVNSLSLLKRVNLKIVDVPQNLWGNGYWPGGHGYDINSGNM